MITEEQQNTIDSHYRAYRKYIRQMEKEGYSITGEDFRAGVDNQRGEGEHIACKIEFSVEVAGDKYRDFVEIMTKLRTSYAAELDKPEHSAHSSVRHRGFSPKTEVHRFSFTMRYDPAGAKRQKEAVEIGWANPSNHTFIEGG